MDEKQTDEHQRAIGQTHADTVDNDKQHPDRPWVPVLYFDHRGFGPEEVALEVLPIRGDDVMPASVGIRVRKPDSSISYGLVPINGGFFIGRVEVEALHAQMTAWLAANPAKI